MAYLALVLSILYSIGWLLGLFFGFRSTGTPKKNLIIPFSGMVFFCAFGVFSLFKAQDAMFNPPKIDVAAWDNLNEGLSIDEVNNLLGEPIPPEEQSFDLTAQGITIPKEVGPLLLGEIYQPAVGAKLSLNVFGTPGRVKQKETLGATAANEMNGLVGLQLVLRENGKETAINEGEHWKYVNGMTAEQVAEELAKAIDAADSWNAEAGDDKYPQRVLITHALEANAGTRGNAAEGQVMSGPNSALKIGSFSNGKPRPFRGGSDEVHLFTWHQPDPLMDGNFSMSDKFVLVGFIDGQLVGKVQSGLPVTEEAEPLPTEEAAG